MKIVQTFWSRPGNANSPLNNSAGWLSAEYHWMSWALSCLQARKFYDKVELVTDELGKEILINRLKLPYTHVSTELQFAMEAYPVELWSLAKIFSYGSQQEPFIHIDGDVFLWKRFHALLTAAPLLAQNVEVNISYYRNMLTAISNRFPFFPKIYSEPIKTGEDIYASNTGVFGGNDLAFIKEYSRQAFEFVDKNLKEMRSMVPDKRPLLNFIFEQYLLYYLAAESRKSIAYFWQEPVTDPMYAEFARFIDIPAVPLVHPVGGYKSRLFSCTHLGNRLRKDYPEYYYRIIDECKNEVALLNKYYCFFNDSSPALEQPAFSLDAVPRSVAALKLLIPGVKLDGIATSKEFCALKEKISDEQDRQLFDELCNFELQKSRLNAQLYNPAVVVPALKNMVDQFASTAKLFESPGALPDSKIATNNAVVFTSLSRNWEVPEGIDVHEFIKEQWQSPATLAQAALWIEPEQLLVQEMFMDQLEMIIISLAKSPVAISDLLLEIRKFFDEEEIARNPQAYEQLIIDTIKHLLYLRIIVLTQIAA